MTGDQSKAKTNEENQSESKSNDALEANPLLQSVTQRDDQLEDVVVESPEKSAGQLEAICKAFKKRVFVQRVFLVSSEICTDVLTATMGASHRLIELSHIPAQMALIHCGASCTNFLFPFGSAVDGISRVTFLLVAYARFDKSALKYGYLNNISKQQSEIIRVVLPEGQYFLMHFADIRLLSCVARDLSSRDTDRMQQANDALCLLINNSDQVQEDMAKSKTNAKKYAAKSTRYRWLSKLFAATHQGIEGVCGLAGPVLIIIMYVNGYDPSVFKQVIAIGTGFVGILTVTLTVAGTQKEAGINKLGQQLKDTIASQEAGLMTITLEEMGVSDIDISLNQQQNINALERYAISHQIALSSKTAKQAERDVRRWISKAMIAQSFREGSMGGALIIGAFYSIVNCLVAGRGSELISDFWPAVSTVLHNVTINTTEFMPVVMMYNNTLPAGPNTTSLGLKIFGYIANTVGMFSGITVYAFVCLTFYKTYKRWALSAVTAFIQDLKLRLICDQACKQTPKIQLIIDEIPISVCERQKLAKELLLASHGDVSHKQKHYQAFWMMLAGMHQQYKSLSMPADQLRVLQTTEEQENMFYQYSFKMLIVSFACYAVGTLVNLVSRDINCDEHGIAQYIAYIEVLLQLFGAAISYATLKFFQKAQELKKIKDQSLDEVLVTAIEVDGQCMTQTLEEIMKVVENMTETETQILSRWLEILHEAVESCEQSETVQIEQENLIIRGNDGKAIAIQPNDSVWFDGTDVKMRNNDSATKPPHERRSGKNQLNAESDHFMSPIRPGGLQPYTQGVQEQPTAILAGTSACCTSVLVNSPQ